MNLPGPKGQPPPINLPARHFSSADKKLLKSGKYADAKIIANGKTYNVHRGILCTRNKWFRTIFESGFREGQNSIIEISGPDNVDRLLEFLYTGEVDLSNLSNETNIMAVANELSVLGDFYLSDKMKTYAALVLGQYLGQYLNAICDVPGYAEIPSQYSVNGSRAFDAQLRPCSSLKLLGSDGIIHHLCDAIRDAYATPSGIHHVYVDFVCAARIRTFECPLIQALKDEIPEFCHDLLTAMMTGLQSSAFEGNKAFEKLKDPLFRTLAVDKVSRYPLDVDPIHDFDLTV